MDNNVLGRMLIDGEPEPAAPRIGVVAVLRLTEATHGNACGLGFADLTTQQLLDATDEEITRINVATSGFLRRGIVPPAAPNDRAAVERALEMLKARTNGHGPTIMRIRDTLSLAELKVSENLLPKLLARPGVELVDAARELTFREDGSLV
jgi:hypothetical protein